MSKQNKIILYCLLVVTVIIALAYCHDSCRTSKKMPEKPAVASVQEQEQQAKAIEAAVKQVRDSAQREIDAKVLIANEANEVAEEYRVKHNVLMKDYNYQADLLTDFLNGKNPCDSIDRIRKLYREQVATNAKKDTACLQIISKKEVVIKNQNSIIASKNRIISTQDKAAKDFRKLLDSSLKIQTRLNKYADSMKAYAKSVQPRAGIYAGVTTDWQIPFTFAGIGPNIGYESKKGLKIEAGAMIMANNVRNLIQSGGATHFTIGIKKTFIRF